MKFFFNFSYEERYTVVKIDYYGDYVFVISIDIYHKLSEYLPLIITKLIKPDNLLILT